MMMPHCLRLFWQLARRADSRARANAGKAWQYLKVEEGSYSDGKFMPARILNGDETEWGGPGFGEKPTITQISLVVR